MGQRASRVLQQETGPQRSTTSSGAKTKRSIPPAQIDHMWRRLVILLKGFLNFIQIKNFLITMMPMETINPTEDDDEFEKIDVDSDQKKTQPKSRPWRILQFQGESWMVGKELREATGKKDTTKHTHDPMTCQHPSDKMLGRGGRNDLRWWVCQACGTRWERIHSSKFETSSNPCQKDRLNFGSHAGKTYEFVYQNQPAYCDWILRTAESGDGASPQLKNFARWLATRENRSPTDVPAGRMDEEL